MDTSERFAGAHEPIEDRPENVNSSPRNKVIKLRIRRTPWTAPPNKSFPRAHLWQWEEKLSDKTYEKEFETTTRLSLNDATTGATIAPATNLEDPETVTIFKEQTKNLHKQQNNGRKSSKQTNSSNGSGKSRSKSSSNQKRNEKGKKGKANQASNSAPTKEHTTIARHYARNPNNIGKESQTKSVKELPLAHLETPTPPLICFGFDEDDEMNADPYQLLIEEQMEHKSEQSPSAIFIKHCIASKVLPEDFLTKNNRSNETNDNKERNEKIEEANINSKADIEKLIIRYNAPISLSRVLRVNVQDELKLSYFGIGDTYMKALSEALKIDSIHAQGGRSCFQRFNFGSCRLTGRGLSVLIDGIKNHPKILKLDLSSNLLGPSGIDNISSLFSSSSLALKSLKTLDLSDNNLSDRSIISLFESLRGTNVEWLNLSKNKIGDNGATAIERFVLDQIPENFTEPEAHSIYSNLSEDEEVFGESSIDSEVVNYNSGLKKEEVQTHISKLRTLLLDWNHINGPCGSRLIKAFEKNKVINELSLSWNGLGAHNSCSIAIINLLKSGSTLKSLNLAYNNLEKSICEQILECLKYNTSLLSLDLSGNEIHDNIVSTFESRKAVFVSEAWPEIRGSYIYTRYSSKTTIDVTNIDQQIAVSPQRNPSVSRTTMQNLGLSREEPSMVFDSNVWRLRSSCWIRDRWVKHTIWYAPGISGPPSRSVFLLLSLPGGASACVKMQMAQEDLLPPITTTSRTSSRSSVSRSSVSMLNRSKTKNGSQSSKLNLVSSSSSLTSFGSFSQSSSSSSLGVLDGSTEGPSYDYSEIINAAQNDRRSTLGKAFLGMLNLEGGEITDTLSIPAAKQSRLSLNGQEPVGRYFANIMLPPGRTVFRFIVRGKEMFARDQDTCWIPFPTDIARKAKPTAIFENDLEGFQYSPYIANYIDQNWPSHPVLSDIGNPDPGPERRIHFPAWSVRKSIFRAHRCDSVKSVRDRFMFDWAHIKEHALVMKAMEGDEANIQHLLYANYQQLELLFTLLAATGNNPFAMNFSDLKSWIRDKGEHGLGISVGKITDEQLSELYEKSLYEARESINHFGKHFKYMVKTIKNSLDESNDQTECKMVRFQFLQFLILFSINLYPSGQNFVRKVASGSSLGHSKSGLLLETHDRPFQPMHSLLSLILRDENEYLAHRDIFRRTHLFHPDILNIFLREMNFLRSLFDRFAVKGHVLHDFLPVAVWDTICEALKTTAQGISFRQLFVTCKNSYMSFEDPDFAPGLTFLEFLESLTRLAHFILCRSSSTGNSLANKISNTLPVKGESLNSKLESLISSLKALSLNV